MTDKTLPVGAVDTSGAGPADKKDSKSSGGYPWVMMICCVAMLVAFGYVVVSGPQDQTLFARMLSALPLLACVAIHFVLHRLTGKPCHGRTAKTDRPDEGG